MECNKPVCLTRKQGTIGQQRAVQVYFIIMKQYGNHLTRKSETKYVESANNHKHSNVKPNIKKRR